jgi:hypothetical protein
MLTVAEAFRGKQDTQLCQNLLLTVPDNQWLYYNDVV